MQEFRPESLIQAAHDAADAATEAVYAMSDLEMVKESAKDLLAILMSEIKADMEGKTSEAELERLARATKTWVDFRDQQKEIVRDGLMAKTKAQNAQRMFDAIQSALSYKKAEMQNINRGGQ